MGCSAEGPAQTTSIDGVEMHVGTGARGIRLAVVASKDLDAETWNAPKLLMRADPCTPGTHPATELAAMALYSSSWLALAS